jgi:hypothetical protein
MQSTAMDISEDEEEVEEEGEEYSYDEEEEDDDDSDDGDYYYEDSDSDSGEGSGEDCYNEANKALAEVVKFLDEMGHARRIHELSGDEPAAKKRNC